MKSTVSKKKLFFAFVFSTLLLTVSISITHAYYSNSIPMSLLATLVGDFDLGDGDINMMFYKENENHKYVKVFSAPAIGYTYDSTKTTCTIECSDYDTNPSANCTYKYNSSNNTFSVDSEDKVTCKFYFNISETKDVTINLYRQDSNGTITNNDKTYSAVDVIPAYGYVYSTYSCQNGSTLTYTSGERKISVDSSVKDTCSVYFDIDSNTTLDVDTAIYVQQKVNGSFVKVETIPQNKTYRLSTAQGYTSKCYDTSVTPAQETNATISYNNGYITIDSAEQQSCTIYLELVS